MTEDSTDAAPWPAPLTGPEIYDNSVAHVADAVDGPLDRETFFLGIAQVHATHAQTAALVMLTEVICTATGTNHYDLDAWRKVLPVSPLRNCRSMYSRRPQCKDRHTADCDYAEPAPEPKHELLPVGTVVLVTPPPCHDTPECAQPHNPYSAIVRGYDMHRTKYRLSPEMGPGEFQGGPGHLWEFADNRVEALSPQPAPRPTGPRIYVQNLRGKQGHIEDVRNPLGDAMIVEALVQWYTPGARPVWVDMVVLSIIPSDEVDRCPNGQTGDKCGSGENQCEPCLRDEDEEGDEIEQSTGLRDNPHSPGCPPIKHRH